MASAEFAVALPGVILVLVLAVSAMSTATDQLRCTDAARATARLLARGDSPQSALDQGRKLAPAGAALVVRGSAADIEVRVQGRPALGLAWLGAPFTPRGQAVAAREAGANDDTGLTGPP